MVVTVHYITKEWEMRHCILAFVRVMYPHTGERLAEHLLKAVHEMHPSLISSIWTITADNASNNSTMADALKELLPDAIMAALAESMSEAGAEDDMITEDTTMVHNIFFLPCLAHTLQLAVK